MTSPKLVEPDRDDLTWLMFGVFGVGGGVG